MGHSREMALITLITNYDKCKFVSEQMQKTEKEDGARLPVLAHRISELQQIQSAFGLLQLNFVNFRKWQLLYNIYMFKRK